jgi:hypothetical protein
MRVRKVGVLVPCLLAVAAAYGGSVNRNAVKRPPVFDIDTVDNLATMDPVALNDDGSAVLRAQILLDRAHFSVGEIDGIFGTNMLNSLKAYQTAHGLPADGVMNAATWETLDVDSDLPPVLVAYTIAKKDVAGPFNRIPREMMEQAKLPRLGYSSPLEALGEKFHASPALLLSLNPRMRFGKAGERILVPNVERAPLQDRPALVVVKKDCSCVEALDGQNQLMAHYPATMGSSHDPLPVGGVEAGEAELEPDFLLRLQPVLGREGQRREGSDPVRTEEPRRRSLDRTVEDSYGNSRNAKPLDNRQSAFARLHPPDELGRDRAGQHGPARHDRESAGKLTIATAATPDKAGA